MDYSIFRFEAVVDFIEIEIYTASITQGKAINAKCKIFNVTFADRQGNKGSFSGFTFRIRLYNLKTFAALQSKIDSIESEFPFSRPPTVTMLELAFDGRLKEGANNATVADLAMLAARMAYFVSRPVSKNTRTYHSCKGSVEALPRLIDALAQKMLAGRNVGIGNTTDDQYLHIYFKTVDRKRLLPQSEWCARFEFRSAGEDLLSHDVEKWQGFEFETLTKHFNWRKENDTATPLQQVIIAGYADRASHRKEIKRHDGGGIITSILPADRELNEFARIALRLLSARWLG